MWIGLLHHVCNTHEWLGGKCKHPEAQEAQARFARARLCLPYNKGRKETLRPK